MKQHTKITLFINEKEFCIYGVEFITYGVEFITFRFHF